MIVTKSFYAEYRRSNLNLTIGPLRSMFDKYNK